MGYSKKEIYLQLLDYIRDGKNEEAKSVIHYLRKTEGTYDFSNGSGLMLLQYSVRYRNEIILQHLIDIGCNINAQGGNGYTPLLMAVEDQDISVVKVLLENNADINFVDRNGLTILQHVVHGHLYSPFIYPESNYKLIFQLFIDRLHVDFLTNKCKITQLILNADNLVKLPIVTFGSTELVRCILEHDSAIDYQKPCRQYKAFHLNIEINEYESTPFCYYTKYLEAIDAQFGILKTIIDAIHALTVPFKELKHEIQYLLTNGKKETVRTVLQSNNDYVAIKFNSGQSFLHLLVQNQNDDVINVLNEITHQFNIDDRDDSGFTALMLAIRSGFFKKVEILLSHGANANFVLSDNTSVLYWACKRFCFSDTKVQSKVAKIIELLLQHGADAQFFVVDYTFFQITILDNSYENEFLERIIIAHFAMLQVRDNSSLTDVILYKIQNYTRYHSYFELYQQNIVSMKRFEVYNKINFYDLLYESEKKLLTYARNQEFLSTFNATINDIYYVGPYYVSTLCRKVAKAVEKIELGRKAAGVIKKLTSLCDDVYFLIVCQIIDFLDIHDLNNLCRV